MLWSDSGRSRMLIIDFQENRFFMIFDSHDVINVTWRRVLRTPLPLLEGVPQVSLLSIHLARSLSHLKPRIGQLNFHDVRGFGLEMPSTHSKSPILAPNSRADAQC